MKIRNKILLYFSSAIVIVTAIALSFIYILFSEYREEEFQQRQKEKVDFTIQLIAEHQEKSNLISKYLDKEDINDFYNEKLIVFDNHKQIIFSSLDELKIEQYKKILENLSPNTTWIETKEGDYDLIGIYALHNQNGYYAISKAYDEYGISKLEFLRNTLIAIFFFVLITVVLLAHLLANIIAKPLIDLANKLHHIQLEDNTPQNINLTTSTYEIVYLTEKFNKLLERNQEAFAFQKNTIHHISHELKTPIAILISELEQLLQQDDVQCIRKGVNEQINRANNLAEIINTLLEISKFETNQRIAKQSFRIDELVFDLMASFANLYPKFIFNIQYQPLEMEEQQLLLKANKMLCKQMLSNLMLNAIHYADQNTATICFNTTIQHQISISITNSGDTITAKEADQLFQHFFRGKNSNGKTGFGLGLTLSKKIAEMHNGNIIYLAEQNNRNSFTITLPLS